MGIVAGGTVEAVGAADLVRAGDFLELREIAVALVADVGRHRAEIVRRSAERRLGRGLLVLAQGDGAGRGRTGCLPDKARPDGVRIRVGNRGGLRGQRLLVGDVLQPRGRRGHGRGPFLDRGGLGSRRDVVVGTMAIDAGDAVGGVDRGPPLRPRRAGVLLVTAQADLGAGPRVELPGVEDRSRLFAADLQVFAGRAVAILAGLVAMDVAFLEGLGVDLVAGRAELVVVDVLRARRGRHGRLARFVGDLREEVVRLRPSRIDVRLQPPLGLVRRLARGNPQCQQAADDQPDRRIS